MAKTNKEIVVLVHGIYGYFDMELGIPIDGMESMKNFYEKQGYDVALFKHWPAGKSVDDLSDDLKDFFNAESLSNYDNVHFVTHSLGGLITHNFITKYKPNNLGRAVFLAPPFAGSPMADITSQYFKNLSKFFSGKVGLELSKKYREENPFSAPNYDFAVISGDKSGRYFFNKPFMQEKEDGPHDGLVSLKSAFVFGGDNNCIVEEDHVGILSSTAARQQTLSFLKTGSFNSELEGCRFPNS